MSNVALRPAVPCCSSTARQCEHALVLLLALLAVRCASGVPRNRLGGLPHPGTFAGFRIADPEHLGIHRYRRLPRRVPEVNGIVYTRCAGFLDLAHVRMSMDWTRYLAGRIRDALAREDDALLLDRREGSAFLLTFAYPPTWPSVRNDPALVSKIAVLVAQRVTLDMMTWHELITWFGYRTVWFFSELPSAFTYEDTISHLIGVHAGAHALREGGEWDAAATSALHAMLQRLRTASAEETSAAVLAVEGRWWCGNVSVRRMLPPFDDARTITPWFVPGTPTTECRALALPLRDSHDQNLGALATLHITPGRRIPRRILAVTRSHVIRPREHFPLLLAAVRAELHHVFGPVADKPSP